MRIKDVYNNTPTSFRGRGTSTTTMRNLNELANLIDYDTLIASTVDIVSSSTADTNSAGTGARNIEICGLDINYKFQTEIVNLNGQTPVTSTRIYLRVFAAQILTAGTGRRNAGDIVVYRSGTGGTITGGVPGTLTSAWLRIMAGFGIGTSGIYTVPAGMTVEARRLVLSSRVQAAELFITSYNPIDIVNNSYQNEFSFGILNEGTTINFPTSNSFRWTEKTDIYFRFISGTGGAIVTADLQLRVMPTFG